MINISVCYIDEPSNIEASEVHLAVCLATCWKSSTRYKNGVWIPKVVPTAGHQGHRGNPRRQRWWALHVALYLQKFIGEQTESQLLVGILGDRVLAHSPTPFSVPIPQFCNPYYFRIFKKEAQRSRLSLSAPFPKANYIKLETLLRTSLCFQKVHHLVF